MRATIRKRTPFLSLLFLCLPIVAALVTGCNDDPSNVGDDYLPQNVEFKSLDLPVSEISIVSGVAVISNGSNEGNNAMLVGQAPDGTVAHGLMNLIDVSDRLKNVTPDQIQKVELQLRTFNYRYGNIDARQLAFQVVSFDGIFGSAAQWSDELVGRINNGISIGEYSGNYADTSALTVELDKNLMADFLNDYYKIDTVVHSIGDTTFAIVTERSLALRAIPAGSMIGSFLGATVASSSDTVRPTLRITLADTVISLTMGVSNWIAHYPASVVTGTNSIVVAGGAPIRTLVKFNLDSIPSGAIIHKAELTLHIVPDQEFPGSTGIIRRVVAYVAGDNPLGAENYLATFPTLGRIFLRGSRPAKDETSFEDYVYFSGFGTTLTQWLRAERGFGNDDNSIPNNGLLLSLDRTSPSLEAGTVDHMMFYGPDAPEGLRPQLRIVYSTQVNV